jgi:integrase
LARALNKLTVRQVAALKEPGRHSDGGGLYFRITPAGGRSWVFMAVLGGKRSEIGLGAETALPLATARRIAGEMREALATGRDPRNVIAPKQAVDAPKLIGFGAFADEYISSVEDGWKSPIHRQQWRSSLRDHAAALTDVPIAEVGTDQVLAVLQPIWLTKPETARRLRGRIEKILAAAKAKGLRHYETANPAVWRGHLDVLLAKQPRRAEGHHAALPYKEAPAFWAELRIRPALAARCLEFTILTAARTGEALGASWGEIDMAAETWTVPASRMKAGVEHVVPLSASALAVLEGLRPESRVPEERIFAVNGAARSNMAMAMLLRRMGQGHITVHGFRSTFKDWAMNETNFPDELSEEALAHTVGSKVRRAYRRGIALERRRALMTAWADYVCA